MSESSNEVDWENVWQRKALEKPYDLKTINGWEKVNISSAFVVEVVASRLNLTKNDRMLEVGCGCGYLTEYFLQRVQKYTGSDRSQNMIDLAKSIFDCEFINCEAASLPFDDNQYDYVVAYSIFHYFPSEDYAHRAFSEMDRVAKKGIYIGDLPTCSHDDNHMLYKFEQFSDWLTSEGVYTDKRFDIWRLK